MAQLVLKNEIVDEIKNDPILFGKVADALDIKPVSLPYLLNNNNIKLTQASVINVLKEHFGVKQDSRFLEEAEKQPA